MLNYVLHKLDVMKWLCNTTVHDKTPMRNYLLNVLSRLLRVYLCSSEASLLFLHLKLRLKLEVMRKDFKTNRYIKFFLFLRINNLEIILSV